MTARSVRRGVGPSGSAAGARSVVSVAAATAGAATLLLLLLFVGSARAQDTPSIDTCPAAKWKALPFLRSHASTATVLAVVDAGTSPGGDLRSAAVAYLRASLLPKVGANFFFLAASVLLLAFFALWRVLRWCCCVACCRASCDAKRERRDAWGILFSRRMAVLKAAMLVVAAAAVALYVVGMAGTSKTIVADAFATVDALGAYVGGVAGRLDALSYAVGNVSGVVDDLQAVVRDGVDPPGFSANITAVKGFLVAVTPPATLAASLTALDTKLTTTLGGALTDLGASLTAVGAGSAMSNALTTVGTAEATAATWTAALADLDAKIVALPGGMPAGQTSDTAVAAFSAALTAVAPGFAGGWATALDAISAAVDALSALRGAGANPLTLSNARLTAVDALVTQLTATDFPAFAAAMTTLTGQYTTLQPALAWLVGQLASVNATVLELTLPMQAAYDAAAAANTSLAAYFGSSPTPAALAASLTGSTTGSLALPAGAAAIGTALAAQAAVLDGAQFDAAAADGAALKAWVTQAKAGITAAAADFNAAVAARNDYFANPADAARYTAMRNAATTFRGAAATSALRAKLGEQDSAPCAADNYAAPSASVKAAGAAAATGLAAFVAGAQAAIAGVPPLAGYATALGAVTLPAATVFDGPSAALDAINAAVVTGGDAAKAQASAALAGFSGATTMLRTTALGALDRVEADVKPVAMSADRYRYSASLALYALPIAAVLLLLLAAVLANYHFGANVATLALLVLLVLGFLLGAVIALALALLGDACPAVEPLIVAHAPAAFAPLAGYYFAGQGASVKAVLATANIVDVDAVLAQVAAGKDGVAGGGALGSYTFRAGPAAALARLNGTVDDAVSAVNGLLAAADRASVLEVYDSVKGLVCCALPDSFSSMWVAFTVGGALALFFALLAFGYLGKLDALPRVDCCGCSCHTRARYAAAVAPGPRPQPGLAYPGINGAVVGGIGGGRGRSGDLEAPRPAAVAARAAPGWDDGTVVAELVVRTPAKK